MDLDYKLTSNDDLTSLATQKSVATWNQLVEYVKKVPYGRTSDKSDLGLVIVENTGTCSSKHAFLKKIADLNHIPNVKLILSIFRMNLLNTPKVASVLTNHQMGYMPEAHCYLKFNNECIDVTSKHLDFSKIKHDIVEEIEIKPEQVITFKEEFHKKFIKDWIIKEDLTRSFEQIWDIREQCIANLSK